MDIYLPRAINQSESEILNSRGKKCFWYGCFAKCSVWEIQLLVNPKKKSFSWSYL
jgi:hypothetical protein